jgi:hypothetical protein
MSDQGETQSPSIKDRIGALLTSQEQPAQAEAPAEAPATPEAPEAPEQPQLPPEVPEAELQEAAQATPEDWVEVELDGEKLQVPPKWHKAFMQERDYTQKRQADADYRKAIEVQAQGLQAQQETFGQLAPLIIQAQTLQQHIAHFQKLDWDTLRSSDPLDYSTKRADYAALLQEQSRLSQAIQNGQAYLNQQRMQTNLQAAQAAAPVIKRHIPDWGAEKEQQLLKLAVEHGATVEELMGFAVSARPWAVTLLEKARKYDELQASKAQLPKKAFTPSPVAKPGAKPTHVSADAASYRKNREQFRQSGGKDAGALRALIKAKLGT